MSVEHYEGGCQCGAVRFEVDLDIGQAFTCNCSRCQRLGSVLSFTALENFDLKSGEDALGEYRFAKKKIAHRFCRVCGIQSFSLGETADGTKMVAVNINCLEGVDPRALTCQHVDGRSY